MASDEADMDALAELVSAGATVSGAARRLRISHFRADYLWARIVARLGPQAR